MSAIPLIVEKRMTDIFHMYTDLVRAPRLQTALHQAHVAQQAYESRGVLLVFTFTFIESLNL